MIFEALLVSDCLKSNRGKVEPVVKHLYYYIFVVEWIFLHWCSRRASKLSSVFCGCLKLDLKRVSQYCFKEEVLIISHFLTDLLEYAYVILLIDSLLL